MYTKVWSKQMLMVKPLEYVFASEEALAAQLQEGDSVKVNDGMGRTEYKLTGFPTSTTEFGDFTLTATINKVEEDNGVTFYRARVKWQRSRVKFILPDGTGDATISYYGDGSTTNIDIVASESDAEITSDAGLTESNSIYIGDYVLLPKIETLPDCSYRMEINGEALTPNDLPKVIQNKDSVFSFVQVKDGKQRYADITKASKVTELLKRNFKVSPTPSDANVEYRFTACSNEFTQQNGTIDCYTGETITYRITKAGYKTIEDSYTIGYQDEDLNVEMEVMSIYRFVYPNGAFNVGDFVLLNNGIGENTQEWTANATSDTDYQGDFTIQGEVKEVDPQTGYLTVEADVIDYPEVSIVADQNGSTISTLGGNQNCDINIVSDQSGAVIESSAGLETVTSVIRDHMICEFESLAGYTIKLESGGMYRSIGSQFLIKKNEIVCYALIYNNKLVAYDQIVARSYGVIRKRHTFTVVASESDATVKIYGVTTSQIQAYSNQVIDYEVSKAGFVTVVGSYTIPNNDCGNNSYTINVVLEQEI